MAEHTQAEKSSIQLVLNVATCKESGCEEPVAGSSITGEGHVCKAHNEREWGRALRRNKHAWIRDLGGLLP